MYGYHTHPMTVTPILAILVFTAISSSLLTNTTALVQAFMTSHLNKSCPSSNPFCPTTSDINQCLMFIVPFIYPKTINDSSSSSVWHTTVYPPPGGGVREFFHFRYILTVHSSHAGMRSRNNW